MTRDSLTKLLFSNRDEKYRSFQSALIPTVAPERMIGVRTPVLRTVAKEIAADPFKEEFLNSLPHEYFEEDQLHFFIISAERDFDACVREVERFLPFVDNWAVCDQSAPKVFAKRKAELLPHIEKWLSSDRVYTVRFAVNMLMRNYLGDDFDVRYARRVASLRADEYYISTVVAWYFATALAKNYGEAIPFLEDRLLDRDTHNRTVRKALESFRISDERKAYIKTLKI